MRLWLLALALLLAGWTAAPEGTGPGPAVGIVSKLPVPRFVSLRTDKVNVRAGPGFQYPVTWVYQRDGLPVEIIGEFDVWRQILAPDGGTGWVHMATIRPRRGFIVIVPKADLHAGQAAESGMVAMLDFGVSGVLLDCEPASDWCKVAVGSESGYLNRADFWGAFPGEVVK
ncbi:MAG: SH3 domain-containing protein [Acidocella sp.]|nr:SH3 domain-containing protein [Acidocella sp.]